MMCSFLSPSHLWYPCLLKPHGRAWKILDKERLVSEVIPNYYVCKKFESFTRQLNGWGFKRLHQTGPGTCSYFMCVNVMCVVLYVLWVLNNILTYCPDVYYISTRHKQQIMVPTIMNASSVTYPTWHVLSIVYPPTLASQRHSPTANRISIW